MATLFDGGALRPLRPRQAAALDALRQAVREGHRRIVLHSPTGTGKCLGKGTPVLMFDGTIKPVEDVVVGDLLMGPDSKHRRVLSLARGREEMFRVTPTKGDAYTVNRSHILSLKRTNDGSAHVGSIVNVTIDEWLNANTTFRHCHKGWRASVKFETFHVPIDPYFLGVWLGDGTQRTLSVSKPDKEIHDLCQKTAADYGLTVRIDYGSSGCPTYHLVAERGKPNPLWSRFQAFDLHKGKHVPHLYKANSAYVRKNILAGLIDTDGHVYRGGCDMVFKEQVLAEDTCFLARSLGLAAYMKPCQKTCTNTGVTGDYFRISISGDLTILPMRLPRKKAEERKQKKDVLVTGIKVESIGEGEYFGFGIDGDRLFMLGDFTVAHNTIIAAHIVDGVAKGHKRPMFVCPAISLVNQSLHSFEAQGIKDIGVIQAQHERTDWMARVQIASVQTLIRRKMPEVDVVLIDEVHEEYKGLNKILDSEEWKDKLVIGLSATPWKKGMGLRWTKLISTGSIQEWTQEGFLSPFVVYVPNDGYAPNRKNLKIEKGEFTEESSAREMSQKKIIGNTVKEWIRYQAVGVHPGFGGFLYAVNLAHARLLQEAFIEAGIPCGYIDGQSTDEQRRETFERFRSKQDKLISSCGCLITGIDEDVRSIWDCQPVLSEIRLVQKDGRGLRLGPGKTVLPIFDQADNRRNIGTAYEIFHDHLDKSKPGDKSKPFKDDAPPKKPRKCSKCNALVPPGSGARCPACGFIYQAPNTVTHEAGELVIMAERRIKPSLAGLDQQSWYSGFLAIAAERGYKPSWADHLFRAKFGDFPIRLSKKAEKPSLAVRAFEHHMRIKRARA